jgi:hypothetical protein
MSDQPRDVFPAPTKPPKATDLIVPKPSEVTESTSTDLATHKEAKILDHPLGSVQLPNLEIRVRELIEMHLILGYIERYQGQQYHYAVYAP